MPLNPATENDLRTCLTEVGLILDKFKNDKQALISILLEVQDKFNYLPKDALILISKRLKIPLIKVYGIASFYKVFSLHPRGKHLISVCLGTACHVRGGVKIVEAIESFIHILPGETTDDRKFTLETVRCLGACALGPIMVVNGNYYGNMTSKKVSEVLSKYQ